MAGNKKGKTKSQQSTPITINNKIVDEAVIFERIAAIIENFITVILWYRIRQLGIRKKQTQR